MRVAVISTYMHDDQNLLWRATEGLVNEQLLIGPRSMALSEPAGRLVRELTARDLGRGMAWQHLSHLTRELKRFEPDLVHLNGELWTVRSLQVVAANLPFVVHGAENIWSHGYLVKRVIRDQLVRRVLGRSLGYASWNMQGAEHATQVVGDENYPTCVVPAVIPPDVFRQTHWHVPQSQELRVLLVGRLERQKGFHLALEAAASWPRRVVITVCGDGSQQEALAQQATRLGIAVRFVGQVDTPNLARLMAEHSLLLQPSITTPSLMEQFGRSVAEALCVGLPVLTSTSGELPNVMGGEPRWTFDEDSVPAIRAALSGLLDQPARMLTEMSLAQRQLARQVDPDYAASKIVDFWRRAAEYEPSARPR
jgi:glycosyltransferase involved in cell wall biosynthesis